jgi:CheY-like chemotaxis protein
VLHLGDVVFIDSSGLGMIVRTLTSVRQAHGELKLCNVPDHVQKVLELSHLAKLFDAHESEEKAVAAFYTPKARAEAAAAKSRSVLCVDTNANVLAYLRELLRPSYDVHTSGHLRDALLLMRITNFDLLLVGPDIPASAPANHAFRTACSKLQVIELDKDFSTRDAAEAGSALLAQIQSRLNAKSA